MMPCTDRTLGMLGWVDMGMKGPQKQAKGKETDETVQESPLCR